MGELLEGYAEPNVAEICERKRKRNAIMEAYGMLAEPSKYSKTS